MASLTVVSGNAGIDAIWKALEAGPQTAIKDVFDAPGCAKLFHHREPEFARFIIGNPCPRTSRSPSGVTLPGLRKRLCFLDLTAFSASRIFDREAASRKTMVEYIGFQSPVLPVWILPPDGNL